MLAAWITSQIAFNGVVQGLVYGLLAMAIVLVYRSSKVINFAIGAMGLIGSSLLVLLTVQYGVPYWIALAIALVAGVVYGAIIELAVVRRLFTAPRVILLVATIGVSQLSVGDPGRLPRGRQRTCRVSRCRSTPSTSSATSGSSRRSSP